ncbi:hypothetical protein FF011L_40090 [Roseimaritima multifibrata]|uniref:Uncharacterized protein n=1 Tax=Roseimaritima multifibrata TaxID=1930274 RepID=A0A517MJZ6_9BACT|nr:hypothetical protein [Roseimaritima multifibrata]QDS95216.1 hypothetical protein FF011L_40090 [Roseimaritima multifibrata]
MIRSVHWIAGLALGMTMLFGVAGCGGSKPVASEEEAMQGMQDMDSGAETAPR